MNFIWYGDGFSMVDFSYYFLVSYVVGLSGFIGVWVLIVMIYQAFCHKGVGLIENESNLVEFVWTFLPTMLVFFLSILNVGCFFPSVFSYSYSGVKVIGRQWYWSYGLSENGGELYDSVISDFVNGVDKPLRLFWGNSYCLYVTSADVIHSFSVPFLSIKVDAIPGRINQFLFVPDYCGVHVGYCSELCGAGHAYMPIVVEVVPPYVVL